MTEDNAQKAADYIRELRVLVDGLRKKYSIDWCDRHTAILACVSPLDSTKDEVTGLAACVIGSNIMLGQVMASAAMQIGKSYDEGMELPEGTGQLIILEEIRSNLDGLRNRGGFGEPTSKGEKGYTILED